MIRPALIPLALGLLLTTACGGGNRNPGRDGGADIDATIHGRCENTTDTDGDGLYDDYETHVDSDGDGLPNSRDLDSDNDGLSDASESGMLGGCEARNTDGDSYPDYLDNDSDNDGLSDREETETYFTDPLSDDSDGDGFSDTAEVATGHDPLDPSDVIPPEDFFVILPFGDPAVDRTLTFGTTLRKADVFFMMDRTGSMSGEASNLKSGLSGLVTTIQATIPDVGVGAGGFAGFGGLACTTMFGIPVCQDGPDGDLPFTLQGVIATNPTEMQASVNALQADMGGATWASSTEALYQAATGAGMGHWVAPQTCPTYPDEEGHRFGYPCFRPGALPIIIPLTDTSSHNGPLTSSSQDYNPSDFPAGEHPHTLAETRAALLGIGARVFGVISGQEVDSPSAAAQAQDWATSTGTVDASGAPIFFMISSDGTGLTDRVAEAIQRLATETPQDITTRTQDGDDVPVQTPPVDATLFIKAITPLSAFNGVVELTPAELRRDDVAFYGVTPGTTVEFTVRFQNDFQAPQASAQVFLAKIVVVGNGVADLDAHDVIIIVPAGNGLLI